MPVAPFPNPLLSQNCRRDFWQQRERAHAAKMHITTLVRIALTTVISFHAGKAVHQLDEPPDALVNGDALSSHHDLDLFVSCFHSCVSWLLLLRRTIVWRIFTEQARYFFGCCPILKRRVTPLVRHWTLVFGGASRPAPFS